MNAGAKMLRSLMLAGILISAASGVARAAANPASCINDTDCIATPQCGGDVCNIGTGKCEPANAAMNGADGWCTTSDANGGDDECKCKAEGAHCVNSFCSIVVPPAGGTAGASGTAGTTGTAGASGTAGTTGTAGAGAAGAGGTKTSSSSGGCSVAPSTSGGFAALLGLALVAGGLVRRRRRA